MGKVEAGQGSFYQILLETVSWLTQRDWRLPPSVPGVPKDQEPPLAGQGAHQLGGGPRLPVAERLVPHGDAGQQPLPEAAGSGRIETPPVGSGSVCLYTCSDPQILLIPGLLAK